MCVYISFVALGELPKCTAAQIITRERPSSSIVCGLLYPSCDVYTGSFLIYLYTYTYTEIHIQTRPSCSFREFRSVRTISSTYCLASQGNIWKMQRCALYNWYPTRCLAQNPEECDAANIERQRHKFRQWKRKWFFLKRKQSSGWFMCKTHAITNDIGLVCEHI
jgi:hypothetical protein